MLTIKTHCTWFQQMLEVFAGDAGNSTKGCEGGFETPQKVGEAERYGRCSHTLQAQTANVCKLLKIAELQYSMLH